MTDEVLDNWLSSISYKSKQDLYENLYLKAIVDSYSRIDKTSGLENTIRDRFIRDLENYNPLTSTLIQNEILVVDFEKWINVKETEKRRIDISFTIQGLRGRFDIECKRLFQQESKNEAYINDGLIRFTELKYARNNQYAGMIGFVVSGHVPTILDHTISRTKAFQFAGEFSDAKCVNWDYSFISNHKRGDDSIIQVYHLLFEFI